MSTWTEVTNYIKTQLKPGVLGNTNVQKILNSILAVVNQINAGEIDPENDSLWDAETIYPADTVPVIWQDTWLVSNIADNEGNVPINASGVVHPTWRVIGSSAGSGIRIWEAIVYPNVLEVVFNNGSLYYLDRAVVGNDPFVSSDFATELAAEQWKTLSGGGGSGLPSDVEEALLNADSPTATNFFITVSELLTYLPDQVIDEGTVTFLSSTSLQVENVVFLRGGVGYVITDETIAVTDNSETVNRVDILYAQNSETPLYTAGTEDGSQAIPTVPDDHVLIRTLFRNSNGDNTQTSPGNGGGTPNLQQVTNKGNSTSKTIQHAPATTDAQSATLGQVKEEASATAVRDKLAGLTGADRLDASAIKNLPSSTGILHAPSDGNFYASKDGAWTSFTPGIQHAPSDGDFYASKDGTWASFSPFVVSGTPSDGDVVTWDSGSPTWAAPSGGGSGLWTDGTGFIYRDGPVVIGGDSSINSNEVFVVISKTVVAAAKFFRILAEDGSEALSVRQNKFLNVGNPTVTASNGSVFKGTGTVRTQTNFLVTNGNESQSFQIRGNGGVWSTSYEHNFGNSSIVHTSGAQFKGGSSSAVASIFQVVNNAEDLVFNIYGGGRIVAPGVYSQTSDPLIEGAFWNDSGTVKISAG